MELPHLCLTQTSSDDVEHRIKLDGLWSTELHVATEPLLACQAFVSSATDIVDVDQLNTQMTIPGNRNDGSPYQTSHSRDKC